MGKRLTYLIVLLGLFAGFLPGRAAAQGGACPDGYYPVTTPSGSYPAGLVVCTLPDGEQDSPMNVAFSPIYPCGSALRTYNSVGSILNGEWDKLQIVPPTYQSFYTNVAHVSFLIRARTLVYTDYTGEFFIEFRSFNQSGSLIQNKVVEISDAPTITFQGETWYYVEFFVDAQTKGYFEYQTTYPSPASIRQYYMSMLRIADSAEPYPPPCPDVTLPAAAATPTPSPSPLPTYTPTPGATQTPTPGPSPTPSVTPSISPTPRTTPFPTQPPTTPTPGGVGNNPPTVTPYQSNIVTAEPTMTAPAIPTIAPINVPSVGLPPFTLPTIPPIVIPTITSTTGISGTTLVTGTAPYTVTNWISNTNSQLTGFISATNESTSWIGGEISGTSAISAANTMAYYVASPIAYTRGLALYMPNLWPYIFAILIMAAWVVINVTIKYGISLLSMAYKLFISALDFVLKWIPFIG